MANEPTITTETTDETKTRQPAQVHCVIKRGEDGSIVLVQSKEGVPYIFKASQKKKADAIVDSRCSIFSEMFPDARCPYEVLTVFI